MAILFKSDASRSDHWVKAFREQAPERELRVFPELGREEEIDYALVWQPPPGLLARLPKLRAIFSVGAGIDHLASDPALPRHIPLVRMVEEGLSSPERPIDFKVVGDAGKLPATIATPLAVVLTELLQNVVDHAFPDGSAAEGGQTEVELGNDGRELCVRVVDDGVGLPAGFDLESSTGLGLQIVRTLVTTELSGRIAMTSGDVPSGKLIRRPSGRFTVGISAASARGCPWTGHSRIR